MAVTLMSNVNEPIDVNYTIATWGKSHVTPPRALTNLGYDSRVVTTINHISAVTQLNKIQAQAH